MDSLPLRFAPAGNDTRGDYMIESAKIWNEPNNKSHWDPEIDPGWALFAETAIAAGQAIKAENPNLPRVLGGISPIDPIFIRNMKDRGVLNHVDVVAVHGFPLDWNLWQIHEWPVKIDEIRAVTDLPVWVTEVGISTFGAEEVQVWGLRRTAELLVGKAPRIHWYSLYDLPRAWEATTRHREAEGSSYYRHLEAIADFDVTVPFCFTPEHRGIAPHHTGPPQVKEEFAEFCAAMVRRYAGTSRAAPELLRAAVG